MASSDYLYTRQYSTVADFCPLDRSTYLYSYSPEERSHVVDALKLRKGGNTTFVNLVVGQNPDTIRDTLTGVEYELRNSASIQGLLNGNKNAPLYLDVSGFDSRVCAALLKNACASGCANGDVRVIYAEPAYYEIQQFCAEGVFHDLAESIDGISPLPGFASIIPVRDEAVCFVPLLGFEGGRFTHLLEHVQPPQDNIYPILGVPGYRCEYPFVAYWGNRRPLETTDAWRNIRFAAANSLVDVFDELNHIRMSHTGCRIKIAPIGTKPHAIGAILFAIKYPRDTELVYDNPKRQRKRTSGVGRITETCVSRLLHER